MGGRDQWPDIGIRIEGIADDDLAHHLADAGDEVVIQVAGDEGPRGGRAVLA
ncbi:Uncharacterised protein [Mycobacteroides abscessus subsp. abscessus]|nr:Uncharacterised protein [Mycobacteroides abscessus subsp. abscessus]